MSALALVLVALCAFLLAYYFYAGKLAGLWQIDPRRSTPAFTKYDSLDYIPAKNWLVLFGHHFASIAGAGPIIGPVIALMLWGWLPAFLWVALGTIFIGGVHDYGSLITSVREGGSSVAEIAQHAISRRAKLIFSAFVWLALILVIAVFAYLCADTFVKEPKIVIPSLGLIPVAMAAGLFLYNLKFNSPAVTLAGLACMAGLVWLGNLVPVRAGIFMWLVVLFVYCYFASILPVNLLLQPRDYLSSFLLFLGVGAGYLAMFISRPRLGMPAFQGWRSAEGGVWPALFVTVACGAVSGFHALISSGTTSKQIASERHVRRIGYGAMIAEALVAVMAIVAVAGLFGRGEDFSSILSARGPIPLFAQGYGKISRPLLGGYGAFIAVTILNAFILTTLDTATRISRYLTEELFGIKNRYLATLLVVLLGSLLAVSGKWGRIWPAFGAANQLVAALALFVLSCWLLARKKNYHFTLWPALFMLLTALAALILQAVRYAGREHRDAILCAVAIILVLLAAVMVCEVAKVFAKKGLLCTKA